MNVSLLCLSSITRPPRVIKTLLGSFAPPYRHDPGRETSSGHHSAPVDDDPFSVIRVASGCHLVEFETALLTARAVYILGFVLAILAFGGFHEQGLY